MRKDAKELYVGKKVLVVGLAKSGFAVAKLLSRLGANVTINEKKEREICTGIEELEQLGIRVVCGDHPPTLWDEPWDFIVKNPGIPYDLPFLAGAEKQGIPIITEVEIGFQISKAKLLAVTGSNGKTTTTTLIYEMLKENGSDPLIAGNIGTVFCEVAEQAREDQWIVLELSSFQLLGTLQFQPEIAVLMNIYDAHLDYHHTREHYIQAKQNIFRHQNKQQLTILNHDQAISHQLALAVPATINWFSMQEGVKVGTFVQNETIYYKDQDAQVTPILPLAQLKLLGSHNVQNVLAAVCAALHAGVSKEAIQTVLSRFSGVEHRLQLVKQVQGVTFYNDSKATNSLATMYALRSFEQKVILIAGGLDRGETFENLLSIFQEKVDMLVAYGQVASILLDVARQAGVEKHFSVNNVKEAVSTAFEYAKQGDIVLLSPAAASWDQFASFEERGDMFCQAVHMLK